ncbi:hypothetical protein [Salipiger pentaromativorans]|uniref:hypothetical protein n=1 Tax=Salipiger pentaromativorans TaxID=2943193 RepID=UPI0021587A21|nr:hypothetical protein [Salipiger pentaromativorans]
MHAGEDPVFARHPMRSFRSDMSLAGRPADVLEGLLDLLGPLWPKGEALTAKIAADRAASRAKGEPKEALTPEYISRVIGEIAAPEAAIVNEYPLRVEHCPRTEPGSYFGLLPACAGSGTGR